MLQDLYAKHHGMHCHDKSECKKDFLLMKIIIKFYTINIFLLTFKLNIHQLLTRIDLRPTVHKTDACGWIPVIYKYLISKSC